MRRSPLVLVLSLVASITGPAGASGSSLPDVAGPKPGPPVLYEPLASAPQLANGPGWSASPLMVSGTDAYLEGEYLYQDFVYDAYGANTTNGTFNSPETVPNSSDTLFGGMTGDLSYPTDAATYGHNAADLLEFRTRLVDDGVAYRITLNTMLDDDVAGVAIGRAWDDATATSSWGYGIGEIGARVNDVVITWGTGAERSGTALPSMVDATSNQIEVVAPLPAGATTVRHFVAVGLFDPTAKSFKAIQDNPSATMPGGARGTNPPPIFNVGFRFDEPTPRGSIHDELVQRSIESIGARGVGAGHWREHGQAKALAARDISAYGVDLDLGKLADPGLVESHVPDHGWLNRLYVSHLDLGEGAQVNRPVLMGKIQPYGVYVPRVREARAPLHLLLHSLSCSYNQYAVFAPTILQQLGEERGAFVLTPEGRGPDGWYHDAAEVDVFEAWADLAAHYALDPERTTIGGYSMGGYGTYKLASQYPDLFAKAFAIVGPADENILGGPTGGEVEDDQNTLRIADNIYNIPLMMWNGAVDELVPLAGVVQYEQRLAELGYRHELSVFTADHFLLSTVDEWSRGRDFLGQSAVDRDPDRIVYRAMPEMDNVAYGLVHDHAYWIAGVAVAAGARSGLVKADSGVDGAGAPSHGATAGAGTLPLPHVRRGVAWGPFEPQDVGNGISFDLTDVSSLAVWVERAGLDPSEPVGIRVATNVTGTMKLVSSLGSVEIDYGPAVTHATVLPEDWS